MKTKEKEYYENKIRKLVNEQIILIFFIFFSIALTVIIARIEMIDKCPECKQFFDKSQISNVLDNIKNKCGSTFMTKGSYTGYGNDWAVFVNECKNDGYCKPTYYKLEDCLK